MMKTKVHSEALDKTIEVGRIISEVRGKHKGPTLVFVGGIHGNEPAGVFALNHVLEKLNPEIIHGSVYGIAGNLWALEHSERFQTEDLNRMWTKDRLRDLNGDLSSAKHQDEAEQMQINQLLMNIRKKEDGPLFFFDMHTTSSETLPFLTVNDSLLNRAFTSQYPLPIILGIEEYLEGPILSYINELGYVAFGFEAGQHDDMSSIENCVAFIYLSMIYTGVLKKKEVDHHKYHQLLAKTTGDIQHTYEIYFHYHIKPHEIFKMLPGYYNFQRIRQNQHLANSNEGMVFSKRNGRIFMPLYQAKGSDGFFLIRKINPIFLKLSAFVRKRRLDRVLAFLPGVKWMDTSKSALLVNKRIARFFTKDVFHLFGYRSVKADKNHYCMYNREAAARTFDYVGQEWLNL
ncbi:succinylglutamate desuccinylase/aspartoacylase family protein [Ekhidna sp.]|uniref:succinylglutamate desuccinylase/aspartoacylase family protein n=1 Tax=Ekhidna sp. TaxID=2608089 RepID=UPI003B5C7EAA